MWPQTTNSLLPLDIIFYVLKMSLQGGCIRGVVVVGRGGGLEVCTVVQDSVELQGDNYLNKLINCISDSNNIFN